MFYSPEKKMVDLTPEFIVNPQTITYTFTGMRTDPDNGKLGPYLVSSDEHTKSAQQKKLEGWN